MKKSEWTTVRIKKSTLSQLKDKDLSANKLLENQLKGEKTNISISKARILECLTGHGFMCGMRKNCLKSDKPCPHLEKHPERFEKAGKIMTIEFYKKKKPKIKTTWRKIEPPTSTSSRALKEEKL